MAIRLILIIGTLGLLFGCKDKTKNSVTETFQVDGDTVTTKSTELDRNLDADYEITDLAPEMKNHIANKLKEAEFLIIKYNGQLPSSKYDANILDLVFEKWRESIGTRKESPEYVIEALGAALGQDIVNSLDCEWKVLTDQYGSDLTVIHKKYKVNGFPFSSAQKANSENRVGSFQDIKLTIKYHIQEAVKNNEIQERH